jgi:hypothetical protein
MSYQIAPNMRFLCYTSAYDKYCCCGIPLKAGTLVCLIFSLIFNISIITFGLSVKLWDAEITWFYISLTSAQIICLIIAFVSVYRIKFDTCYYTNIALQFLLVMDMLTVVLNILMNYGIGIKYNRLTIEAYVIYFSIWVLYILVSTYSSYMLFSYTKNLGIGVLSHKETSITRGNVYIPPNLTNASYSADEWSRTSGHSFACEKIILTHQNDIIFAQNAQNSIVDGSVLPSGIVVPPSSNGMRWRVFGNEILLI